MVIGQLCEMDRLTDRPLMKLNFCGRCDSVDAGRSDGQFLPHAGMWWIDSQNGYSTVSGKFRCS